METFAALSKKLIGDRGTKFAEQRSRPSIDSHDSESKFRIRLEYLRKLGGEIMGFALKYLKRPLTHDSFFK